MDEYGTKQPFTEETAARVRADGRRELVVAAGKRLVEAGLIVRTWGNVSARLDAERFVITPSGKPYVSLTPDDVAAVRIRDGRPLPAGSEAPEGGAGEGPAISDTASRGAPGGRGGGPPKPSSEKDLHAAIYRLRPDVRFIIHTHQMYASVVSTLRTDVTEVPPDLAPCLGPRVRCARFALPTTKRLARHVAEVVARAERDERAVLLANHGAVCFGADPEQVFAVAEALEEACRRRLAPGSGGGTEPRPKPRRRLYNSVRRGEHFFLYLDGTGERPFPEDGPVLRFPLEAEGAGRAAPREPAGAEAAADVAAAAQMHRRLYARRRDAGAVVHAADPAVVAASRTGRALRPFLDDFAQIIGPSARVLSRPLTAATLPVEKALRGRSAVLIEGDGGLCCGPTPSDAVAAAYVLTKNCRAAAVPKPLGPPQPIPFFEALLMRFVYTVSYSKRAGDGGRSNPARR